MKISNKCHVKANAENIWKCVCQFIKV
jgi:hypothetical protein